MPSLFYLQRDTNDVVRLGGFLLASRFFFHRHVQGFAIRRERQAVRVDRRVEGFCDLLRFRVNHAHLTGFTVRHIGFIAGRVKQDRQ